MSHEVQRREWAERVRMYGPQRATLNVKNATPERAAEFYRTQEAAVLPLLREQLVPSDRVVLDYGCGTGRWSERLANLVHGRCVAVDPTPEILAAAPQGMVGVELREYREGRLPLAAGEADVVWACLVLNAIVEEGMFAEAVREIDRVLRPGGLVFVVDLTRRAVVRSRWSVLRTVDEYAAAFRDVAPLRLLGEYPDRGETHSIMAGRKLEVWT